MASNQVGGIRFPRRLPTKAFLGKSRKSRKKRGHDTSTYPLHGLDPFQHVIGVEVRGRGVGQLSLAVHEIPGGALELSGGGDVQEGGESVTQHAHKLQQKQHAEHQHEGHGDGLDVLAVERVRVARNLFVDMKENKSQSQLTM